MTISVKGRGSKHTTVLETTKRIIGTVASQREAEERDIHQCTQMNTLIPQVSITVALDAHQEIIVTHPTEALESIITRGIPLMTLGKVTEEKRMMESATRGEMTEESQGRKGTSAGNGTKEGKKNLATGGKTTKTDGMIDTRKMTSRRGKTTEDKTGGKIA